MAQAKPNNRFDFKSRDCFETDVAQLSKMTVRINTTQQAVEDATIRCVKEGIADDEARTAPPRHENSNARAEFIREEEEAAFAARVCTVELVID